MIINKITDWLKVFIIVEIFLLIISIITDIKYFYGLTLISIFSAILGYVIFETINQKWNLRDWIIIITGAITGSLISQLLNN